MLKVKSPQDLGAGIMFLLIGLAGIVLGRDLDFGSARNMGPGYFPLLISGFIVLIGAVVAGRSFTLEGPAIERLQLRPILMLLVALAVFSFLIREIGVVLTSILMMVVAAYARPNVSIVETIIFAICVATFVAVVFVFGLNQPMPLWWNG
ncbi:MAG: tripartite tricarboxylate transporter TctB family protein [Mesorhizobium sp.]|nr:tripartite tricarboxylate transporter TctB family protein [Mesorhizobium sp.]